MTPRAMTIHLTTLTMEVREESARSMQRWARFRLPDAKIIRSSICPTIGMSGIISTGLTPYKRQSAIITHGPTTEGYCLFSFIDLMFQSLFLHLFPYLPVCPFLHKREQGLWHGVAAATLGAGHRLGIYRCLPFDVEGLEGVAAVIAFECCYSSQHTLFFLAANVLLIIIRVKFIIVHLTLINQKKRQPVVSGFNQQVQVYNIFFVKALFRS